MKPRDLRQAAASNPRQALMPGPGVAFRHATLTGKPANPPATARLLTGRQLLRSRAPAPALAAMQEEAGPGADMEALVRRLRLHRPGPSPYEPADAVAPAPDAGELFRPRRAAVLVCLFRGAAGELRVILTKRSSSLSTHSGEVALPGGKAEEGDADDAATALREAKEEIGLDPALVTIVTSLEHCLSKHLLVVVPIVGILSDINAFKPVLNAAEVDKIFDVPLEMFLKDENRTSTDLEWMGQEFTLHNFSYSEGNENYMIWGLTAGILVHAASVVYQRPPDFAEKRPKFNLPKYSKECRPMPRAEAEH